MIDADLLASIDGRTFIAFEIETGASLEDVLPVIQAKQAGLRRLSVAERIIEGWLHAREDAPITLAAFAAAVKPFAEADEQDAEPEDDAADG